ncbi:MAG: serine/threonine-protein kinase [Byssovorax sp.]
MQLKPGDRIDRYTLVAPLGAGAQGAVWRVLDPLDGGARRALKLVPTSGLSAGSYERVRREAQTLASTPHPNLIACYGLFEDVSAGLLGIALELVDGAPCHEVTNDPRMTAAHRDALLVQLAEVLAFVHASQLVHRDLKAENVLVTDAFWSEPRRAGTIKLVDFGIAIQVGNPRPLTQVGGVVGTAPYLAPEAIVPMAAPDAPLPFARDLFAYGVLAYELLLDKHPTGLGWDASPIHFIRAYTAAASGAAPWPPPGLPARWQEPIARCLAIDATRRPSSGSALLDLVRERALDPAPIATLDPAPALAVVAPSIAAREVETAVVGVLDQGPIAAAEEPLAAPPPARPYTVRLTPAPPRRSKTLPVVIALGVASLVAVGLWLRAASTDQHGPQVTVVSSSVAALPSATPRLLPSAAATPATSACPPICCGGTACTGAPNNARGCSSGRACVAGSCESRIATDGEWRLRVVGVSANGKEISPRPEVCLRRASARGNEPWSCAPAGSGDTRAARLHITTAELGDDGVDVSINRSPKGPSIAGKGVKLAGIGVAALCKGLNVRFAGTDHLAYAVTVFLDDAIEADGAPP